MPQFARPNSDALIGNFTDDAGGTTNIFGAIDEQSSPNDADFIQSPTSPVNEVYVCGLSSITDPESSSGHVMRMRTSADQDGQETIDFTQELRQGYVSEGTPGTLIASQQRLGVTSTAWTTSEHTLSGAEADAITDYSDLFLRFVVNVP